MTARDGQRSRVYDAEHLVRSTFDRAEESSGRQIELHGSLVTLPMERKFASVESVQAYADKVLALNWVRARWQRAERPVTVRARAGARAAHYEDGVIAVPLHSGNRAWALRELVVLHELAHHLEPTPEAAAHGPEFVGRYLTLVSEIVGAEAGFLLRTTLAGCDVAIG